MKRMVLIPEERLLRYEERDKQRVEHRDDKCTVAGRKKKKKKQIPYRWK